MWILTQNGKRILSTEGMDEIYVSDPAEGKTDYAVMIFRKKDGKPFALGFYNEKKRAVIVLEEIFEAQAYYINQDEHDPLAVTYSGNITVPPKAYRMPPDDKFAFLKKL